MIQLPLTGEYWRDVEIMQKVDSALKANEGDAEVVLIVQDGGRPRRLRSRSRFVNWTEELSEELEEILGTGSVWSHQPQANVTRANNEAAESRGIQLLPV